MPTYTFDASLYASIEVTAKTEAAARAAVEDIVDALDADENFLSGYNSRQTDLTVNSVRVEADESEFELIEQDGVPAI